MTEDLTEVEQLKLHLTEAEATMLNLEWRLGEATAALADAKGVLDAAEAWRDWFPHADSMFAPENALIGAVDARRGLSGGKQHSSSEQLAQAKAELFRAGIVPGACPACGSTASAHLCSTDEVAAELRTLQRLTERQETT